jgi:peptidoglycan hydrolase CwlO-like protein
MINIKKSVLRIILLFILILVLVLPNFQSLAMPPLERQRAIEADKAELAELKKRIEQYEANIEKTEKEKRTLRNQISILRNRIAKLDAQIRQGNIAIRNLGVQITDIENSIEDTSLRIKNSRERLAALLRVINRDAQQPLVEIFLAGETLSDFFNNLNALEILNTKNKEIFNELVELKFSLDEQKELTEDQRRKEKSIVSERLLLKQERVKAREEQERLMRMTEAEHREYLRKKREAEESVAEIRARIVRLLDVPEGELLSFEELLGVARWVQTETGIRPAFLLSIIAQESAMGRNVGGCHLVNFETSEGVCVRLGGICTYIGRRVPRIMIPSHIPYFLNITRELGRDPKNTPVSCVMLRDGRPFGFGGAMGPAQFIPKTWMLVRDEVSVVINRFPNPWKIHDSFLASGMYLRKHGGTENELRAAMRYFSGSRWSPWEERIYGRPVITRANCFQVFIDQGTMTEDCRRRIEAFVNM